MRTFLLLNSSLGGLEYARYRCRRLGRVFRRHANPINGGAATGELKRFIEPAASVVALLGTLRTCFT